MKMNVKHKHIKLDVQTIDVRMNDFLKRKILNMIDKLETLLPGINRMDIYLKRNEEGRNPHTVLVRFGASGVDFTASDSGQRWKLILKNVEKRLISQIEKKKVF